ncbi:MAG: glycerol-3-phosphate 1-O-acyltransferase PlsY [Clostridiales Family XIII bacterium]|jgi:glycerol-3-phosphate acyltransferase PlsY|nr:glycerol-3-phosphate 1-O-acyltransferase PlsY [Clostridiales Family XIII bacterium]
MNGFLLPLVIVPPDGWPWLWSYFKFEWENGSYTYLSYLVVLIVFGYFLGNVNPAIIIGRLKGVDIRKQGSGNAGTTNALRTLGKGVGAVVFLVDVLKGFVPVFVIKMFADSWQYSFAPNQEALLCGLFIILGHMWPMLFRFKGGKGVATTFGVLLAVAPVVALILIGVVLLTVAVFRMVSLGVMIAAAVAVPLSCFMDLNPYPMGISELILPWWILVVAMLILIKHRGNFERIVSGTESKLKLGKKETAGGI